MSKQKAITDDDIKKLRITVIASGHIKSNGETEHEYKEYYIYLKESLERK